MTSSKKSATVGTPWADARRTPTRKRHTGLRSRLLLLLLTLALGVGAFTGCDDGQTALSPHDVQTVAGIQKAGGKTIATPVIDRPYSTAVTTVDFSGAPMDTKMLAMVCTLDDLKMLIAPKAKINDNDLKSLESLHSLESVDFSGTPITGAGLRALHYCRVRDFNLADTLLDDEGMKSLHDIGHNLMQVNLAGTKITDAGLAQLKECMAIASLDVSGTKIKGSTLKLLPKGIRKLNLSQTPLSERSFSDMSDMLELTELMVANTNIGDDSLPHIEAMAELQNRTYNRRRLNLLDLRGTKISKEGIGLLQRSLSSVKIQYDP